MDTTKRIFAFRHDDLYPRTGRSLVWRFIHWFVSSEIEDDREPDIDAIAEAGHEVEEGGQEMPESKSDDVF